MPTFNRHSAELLKRAIDSGITSPDELANLMGQTSVESAGFSTVEESFNYRDTDRALAVVKGLKHRHTRDEVEQALATRDPETIANLFYDTHPSLGNKEAGDGWRFHGRGVIQLTGRENYERFGRKIGVDLIENPDLVAEPAISADVAIAYWKDRVRKVDPTDAHSVTVAINGGNNGYRERVAAVARWSTVITPGLVEGIQQESIGVDDLLAMNVTRPARAASLLHQGVRGDDVRELQTQLHDLGYPLRPDGDFGRATRDAVMMFQRNHGLTADGIAGPQTIASATTAHRSMRDNPGPYTDEAKVRIGREPSPNNSINAMFEAMCRAGGERDVDGLCIVGHAYRSTTEGQDWLMQGATRNAQLDAEAIAAQQGQEHAQQSRGRAMSR